MSNIEERLADIQRLRASTLAGSAKTRWGHRLDMPFAPAEASTDTGEELSENDPEISDEDPAPDPDDTAEIGGEA